MIFGIQIAITATDELDATVPRKIPLYPEKWKLTETTSIFLKRNKLNK